MVFCVILFFFLTLYYFHHIISYGSIVFSLKKKCICALHTKKIFRNLTVIKFFEYLY